MYRVNPFTYIVEGFLATSLANAPVHCLDKEYVEFEAPSGTSCGEYIEPYLASHGGYLLNNDTSSCAYCSLSNTNDFLESNNLSFDNRWRDLGIVWAYIVFNILAAYVLYWLMRVPKRTGAKK